jgi:hypothetical protein
MWGFRKICHNFWWYLIMFRFDRKIKKRTAKNTSQASLFIHLTWNFLIFKPVSRNGKYHPFLAQDTFSVYHTLFHPRSKIMFQKNFAVSSSASMLNLSLLFSIWCWFLSWSQWFSRNGNVQMITIVNLTNSSLFTPRWRTVVFRHFHTCSFLNPWLITFSPRLEAREIPRTEDLSNEQLTQRLIGRSWDVD